MTTGFPNHALVTKVELLVNATWTDITAYVYLRDPVVITFGRPDETTLMQASQLTLTLDNRTGRFTPFNASGNYYPYIQLNNQIRVSVNDQSVTGVTYSGYRFWGEVSSWPVAWIENAQDVYAQITASGIWRRLILSTTTTLGSPYTRWNTQLGASNTIAAYWPMEDGSGSTNFACVTPGQAAMTIVANTPTFSSCTAFPGSDALPQLNGAELSGLISTSASPSQIIFRFCVFVQSGGDTGVAAGPLARLHLGTNTTINYVDVTLQAAGGGPFIINGYNSSGTKVFTGTLTQEIWGIPIMCQVGLVKSGTSVIWSLNTILPNTSAWYGTVTGTLTSSAITDASSVIFSPGAQWKGVSVGQAEVLYANPSITTDADALGGWEGENALTRFERICTEEGIASEAIGTTTTTMGPQVDDTLVNVLQMIETTDNGQMYESRDQFGLGYRTMASLQNQSSALTLNYAAQQLFNPLTPYVDDQLIRNDITLTNYDGYAVRVYLSAGADSIKAPPNGVGAGYQYTATVSSASHSQINAVGLQILNCGCAPVSRYPAITVNLARITTAPLFSAVPSMRIGDYLTLSTMPAYSGPATQSQLVWGWTETFGTEAPTWTFAFNTIPETPWTSGFSPGTTNTGQVPASPTTASQSGSVSGAEIAVGAVTGVSIAAGTVSAGQVGFIAGSIGGVNVFTAAPTPYDWTFTPASGTTTTFIATSAQVLGTPGVSLPMSIGDTFTNSSGRGGPFTVSAISTTSGADTVTVTFFPTASSSFVSTDVLYGGTNGNVWFNTSSGNAMSVWESGVWTSLLLGTGAVSFGAGISTYIASTAPTGTIVTGSLWIDTATGNAIYVYSGSAWVLYQFGTGSIAANSISASQIVANTITAGQIASGTITATQINASAGITGSQIAANTIVAGNIAANTITAAQLHSGIVYATIVDGTTITGAQLIAYGSTGEVLVYSATPASGNLIGSWSANSGTDGNSNAYKQGLWIYDSGGNSMGFVPGGSGAASQLAMSTGSGTPTPPSGAAGLYGAQSGGLQVVDGTDGEPYGTQRRTMPFTSNSGTISAVQPSSNSIGPTTSVNPGGTGTRLYRIHGILYLVPGTSSINLYLAITAPSGTSGLVSFVTTRATTLYAATEIGPSSLVVVLSGTSASSEYVCTVDGMFTVTTAGSFNLVGAVSASGSSFVIAANSFLEFMPV